MCIFLFRQEMNKLGFVSGRREGWKDGEEGEKDGEWKTQLKTKLIICFKLENIPNVSETRILNTKKTGITYRSDDNISKCSKKVKCPFLKKKFLNQHDEI